MSNRGTPKGISEQELYRGRVWSREVEGLGSDLNRKRKGYNRKVYCYIALQHNATSLCLFQDNIAKSGIRVMCNC